MLAYSTVSQIGYMFLALGTAEKSLALFAVAAAIFHLFTRTFFKAVLFLSAGSVMHGMGNVIDMRKFSGLPRPAGHASPRSCAGPGHSAGLPLLSGFYGAKDAILESVLHASRGGAYGGIYQVLFWSALLTAALTAFYTFRAYFRTFWGETKVPPEAGEHAHESPSVMTIPLIVLSIGAVFVGIVVGPITHWISDFLGRSDQLRRASGKTYEEHFDWLLMAGSSAFAVKRGQRWRGGCIVASPVQPRRSFGRFRAGITPRSTGFTSMKSLRSCSFNR